MAAYGFTTEIRVRFAETDAQGIAHHAAYLVWFELARVEYLAQHAGGYQALRDQGIEALVTEAHVCYGVPARFDDGWTSHACVDARTLRPTRVPEWLRAAIATAEVKAEAKA